MASSSSEFNSDELEAPAWLDNNEFFTSILQKYENDNTIMVENVKFSPASKKGDHYASVTLRATVNYTQAGESKIKSVIIKTMPEMEGHKKALLTDTHIFETEIGMYTKILPKFEQLLRVVGDTTKLAATCLYHSLEPKQVIIFEDLSPQGFTVIRDRFLNLEEIKLVYLKIAKLHAIGYKLAKEQPTLFDQFQYSFATMKNVIEDKTIQSGIDLFIDMLEKTPTLRKYKPYFVAMQPTLLTKCFENYTEYRENPEKCAFYALCHGDFHYKNLMFKHDAATGSPCEAMLLDYQISFMGSFAIDLVYSYYTIIIDTNLRLQHFDELLQYYYAIFRETLEKIGYKGTKVPSIEDLRKECLRLKHLEIFLFVTFLPYFYLPAEEQDPEKVMSSIEIRRQMYLNSKFQKDLHAILERYESLNYFQHFL